MRPYVNHYQDNWSQILPTLDNVQLTLPYSSIGISLYELGHGVIPKKSFDWKEPVKPQSVREELSVGEALDFVRSLERAYDFVRGTMERSQQSHQLQANKKRREPDFKVKDKVWLLTDNIHTDRPSRKLDHQQLGPYDIVEKRGYSYLLDLPDSLKGKHQVFHASLLRKAPNNPLPGQVISPPPPVNITGDDEYELTTIRAVKKCYTRL